MAIKPKPKPEEFEPTKASESESAAQTAATGSPSTLDTDNPHWHRFTKTVLDAKPGEPNAACDTEGCKARAHR